MQPYRIYCLTCSTPLKIDDPSLVGEIFNCPKCFSMVQVTPPPDAIAPAPVRSVTAPKSPASSPPKQAAAAALLIAPLMPQSPSAASVAPSVVPSSAVEPPPVASPPAALGAPAAPLVTPTLKKWLALSGSGAAGVILTLSVWFIATRGSGPQTAAAQNRTEDTQSVASTAAKNTSLPQPAAPKANPITIESRLVAVAAPDLSPKAESHPSAPSPPPSGPDPMESVGPPIEKSAPRVRSAVSQPSEPPLSRPLPPPSPALAARLAVPLSGVKLPATPLKAMLETIGALGAVKIQCDTAALARVGMTWDDAAAVQLESASLADVLRQALQSRGLTFVATGEEVIVTLPSPQEASLKTVSYAVEDLAPDSAGLEQLATMIRAVVMPQSWEAQGGRATLVVADRALVVHQSAEGHWQLLLLCEKLRLARGLATRSGRDPAWLASDARRRQLAETLKRPVSLHAADGVPLAQVARTLAARGAVAIDIDELSLMRSGISPQVVTRLHMDGAPLDKTLDHALKPLGLTWRPIGPATLSITTPEAMRTASVVEVYPVRRLAVDAKAGQSLAARLMREIAPESWSAEGGTGSVLFDPASRALVVCQPHPIQAQIEAALVIWEAD